MGGKSILAGLLLILLFLFLIVKYHLHTSLGQLVVGDIVLVLFGGGLALLIFGYNDLRAKKAQPAGGGGDE